MLVHYCVWVKQLRHNIARNNQQLRIFLTSGILLIIFLLLPNLSEARSLGDRQGRQVARSMSDPSLECIPSSVNDFPWDGLTRAERQQGWIFIHLLIVGYVCLMLAIVCDDYFVPSLEQITQVFKIHPDVAGSTFMAVGTSSPELFSSIIGSFISESDIGIGTIVGSAVFNLLAVIAVAGLAVWSKKVQLDWYPICRDCLFYALTVSALVIVIQDGTVSWKESVCLLSMYLVYILIMYCNAGLEKFSHKLLQIYRGDQTLTSVAMKEVNHQKARRFTSGGSSGYASTASRPGSGGSLHSYSNGGPIILSASDLKVPRRVVHDQDISLSRSFRKSSESQLDHQRHAFATPSRAFIGPNQDLRRSQSFRRSTTLPEVDIELHPRSPILSPHDQRQGGANNLSATPAGHTHYTHHQNLNPRQIPSITLDDVKQQLPNDRQLMAENSLKLPDRQEQNGSERGLVESDSDQSDDSDESPSASYVLTHFPHSSGPLGKLHWLLAWPARLLFWMTIPERKSLFLLTFTIACGYIATLTYFCVWGCTVIGDTMHIPDTVAGLTILAAGTSIPELISCVIVARSGLANMAVSNAVGSNIFDILFCLGAPWLVKSAFFSEHGLVELQSGALVYTAITLLTTILLLLVILKLSGWTLDYVVGIKCAVIYLIFVLLACLYELNIFGHFNLPQCPYT